MRLFKPCDRGGGSYKHALSPVIEVLKVTSKDQSVTPCYQHALSLCVAKVEVVGLSLGPNFRPCCEV